ncbi:MAG TPA: alkaline phosphatase D family protein [Polyangiales bacterium]|nr:alkaline phosphatase D family protein [Polyangiales bacterium]
MASIGIALGELTQDSVRALIVAQGLGSTVPRVRVRPTSGAATAELILQPLRPGATIAARLEERDVRVYRVRAPVTGEVILEAEAAGAPTARSAPIRALPAQLADVPGGLSAVLATCVYYWPAYLQKFAATMRGCYGLGVTPTFVFLAGDNIYLDVPKPSAQRPGDVVDRYLKYFLDSGYMAARAKLPAFSTYDDHEYWNDYPERAIPVSLWLSENEERGFRAAAMQCLELFQRSINPQPIGNARFAYRVDIAPLSILVIDTRSERDLVDAPRGQLMPEEDLLELEAWAAGLTGPGVLVLGQPLWIEPVMTVGPVAGDHNVSFFKQQYYRVCRALENAPWDILICSGDVHYSRLLRIETRSRRALYELVASPLVSIPSDWATAKQYLFGGSFEPSLEHELDDTTKPPYPGWQASYQMGTGNGTVFSLLNFQPAGAAVSVGVSFVDTREGAAAKLVPETELGRAALFPAGTPSTSCTRVRALELGRRVV